MVVENIVDSLNMMRNQLASLQRARNCYWSSDYYSSFYLYRQSFEKNPKNWWLALEAIRCLRKIIPDVRSEKIILYSPNYIGNSYQRNLYSTCSRYNYKIISVEFLEIDEWLAKVTRSEKVVFHQHWLKEIYWKAQSIEAGLATLERYIGVLKVLKAYGAIICWTLHNLIDHDATPLQKKLNDYALRQITEVADKIFIHSVNAGEMLSSHCKIDVSDKYVILEHPLYDDLLHSVMPRIPQEIKRQQIGDSRVLIFLGMIRPYKGVPDLIRAFQRVVEENIDHGLYLIIAGQLQDPEVVEILNGLDSRTRKSITLLARRLKEDELAGLMQLAHVSVAPHREILTSGSYYLATTFAKPTVAPRKGMFTEIIKDGNTGFMYDGTIDGLSLVLHNIAKHPVEDLQRVGGNALKACSQATISKISARLFSLLEAD